MKTEPKLLTREEFRRQVFKRDKHTCVFCGNSADDAHHILERRLWHDGGYYIDNGASVCEPCHYKCETTEYSVEQVREACGITQVVLPKFFYDGRYDKWGNPILEDGTRLIGELFYDESVQKVLKAEIDKGIFRHYVKYPRTLHVPWSLGMHEEDRMHTSMDQFYGREVVVTEKLDGENTTMYRDYIHARSVDGRNHISRAWVKNLWSKIAYDIPTGWRICGENMYAVHSIKYTDLESYFYGFSIWTDKNICLSYSETLDWFSLLGINVVPELYRGVYDEKKIQDICNSLDTITCEGVVIRLADSFSYRDFSKYVGKYVRKDHVSTIPHWFYGREVEVNGLNS